MAFEEFAPIIIGSPPEKHVIIFPVGLDKPTRFDIMGVDESNEKYTLGYVCNFRDQAESTASSILAFAKSVKSKKYGTNEQ